MLKNWGSWFGKENENGPVGGESDSSDNKLDVRENDEKEQITTDETHAAPQLEQKPKSLRGYIYNFASSASKKFSESVVGTAETLRKSVEEGKLGQIIDKTILGDFQREQERFLKEKNDQIFDSAVPPWVGYYEEDAVQEQILALSADKRHFLRDPPAGVQFDFDFDQMYAVAMVMLEEDELLRKMRFHLVPKQVKEEIFWRNYFYRVSLIKQSAQLTALAVASKTGERQKAGHQSFSTVYSPKSDKEVSIGSPTAEFVSDSFESCKMHEDGLQKGMEQLVLSKDKHAHPQEETVDWERELQEELEEYDVLVDNENHDENWDREIEEMLKGDS